MVKPTTIRLILAIIVHFDWFISEEDFSNAFLHSDLTEDVYMNHPPSFVDPSKLDYVCKLDKSLYELK